MGDIGLFLPIMLALGAGIMLWAHRRSERAGRPEEVRRKLAELLARDAFPGDDPAALLPLADLLLGYASRCFPDARRPQERVGIVVMRLSERWDRDGRVALMALRALSRAPVEIGEPALADAYMAAIRRSYDPSGTMDAAHALRRFERACEALPSLPGANNPFEAGRALTRAVRACRGDFDCLREAIECVELLREAVPDPDTAAKVLQAFGPARFHDVLGLADARALSPEAVRAILGDPSLLALDATALVRRLSPAPEPEAEAGPSAPAKGEPAPGTEAVPDAAFLEGKRIHEHLPLPEGLQEGPLACAVRVVLMRGFIRPTNDGAFDGGRRISETSLWRQSRSEIERAGGNRRTFGQALRWLQAEGVAAHDRHGWHAQGISQATVAGAALLRAAQALKRRPPTDPRVNVPTRDARA